MKFDHVKLFHPTEWGNMVGDLASIDDKKFNWFLCSKRKYDAKYKVHYIIVSPEVAFYCEKTGKTLRVKNSNTQVKLLISSNITPTQAVEKYHYDGITFIEDSTTKEQLFPVYRHVHFIFRDGILSSITSSEDKSIRYPQRCGVVKYVKKNNSRLQKIYSDIPTCDEIDQLLEHNSCEDISLVLYHILEKLQ